MSNDSVLQKLYEQQKGKLSEMTEKFNGTHLVEIYWGELYVKGFKFLDEKSGIIAKVGKPEYDYNA